MDISEAPQRRYCAAPDEISGAALFLRDDSKASFVTGHILKVDGGCAVRPSGRSARLVFAAISQDLSTSLCNS
jgi:hypothetical protein